MNSSEALANEDFKDFGFAFAFEVFFAFQFHIFRFLGFFSFEGISTDEVMIVHFNAFGKNIF